MRAETTVFIPFLVMVPILALGAVVVHCGAGADVEEAQKNATKYLKVLGVKGPVICQRDRCYGAYVSCTVKDEVTGQLIAFECTGTRSWDRVCRLSPAMER